MLISPNTTILEAIQVLESGSLRLLLAVDTQQRVVGAITDGDIRRYLLEQTSLQETVEKVKNTNPVSASLAEGPDQLLMKMHSLHVLHLPIVNESNQIIGLETIENLMAKNIRDNWVIFMAGGKG